MGEVNGAMIAQIRQLSAFTVERLRSDVIVTSMAQAVEELVCNSIDAGSTHIKARHSYCFSKVGFTFTCRSGVIY